MTRDQAKQHLARFNGSVMAKNPHRRWIGLLLERIARGEDVPSVSVTMVCRALEIKADSP